MVSTLACRSSRVTISLSLSLLFFSVQFSFSLCIWLIKIRFNFVVLQKARQPGPFNHQSSSKTSRTRLERGSICSHGMIKRTTVTVKWLYYTQLNVYFFDQVIVSVLLVNQWEKNFSVSRKHILRLTRNFNEGTQ